MMFELVAASLVPGLIAAVLGVGFWIGGFVVAYYVYQRYTDDSEGGGGGTA